MEKRKSPKEIIESEKKPAYEHVYIKFPGQEMISAEAESKEDRTSLDTKKITELFNHYRKKDYSMIHTHPASEYDEMRSQFPTARDFEVFMAHPEMKTMIVAQTNKKTGDVLSYFAVRKKKRAPKNLKEPFLKRCLNKLLNTPLDSPLLQRFYLGPHEIFHNEITLKNLSKGLNLEYKLIYVKNKKTLPTLIFLILFASIFFSSLSLTGFAIAGLSQKTSGIIGAILFVLGILGGYVYFERQNKIRKWQQQV